MKRLTLKLAIALCLIAMGSQRTSASLIGDTVDCDLASPFGSCSQQSAVVGGGLEFTAFGVFLEIDIADSSILLSTQPGNDFGIPGVLTLSDLDWVNAPGQITGFQLSLNGNITGFTSSDITFGSNEVVIDFETASFDVDTSATIQLQVTHSVPEPSIFLLFPLGLAAMRFMLREKKV